jgi:uncharacterized protein YgbK (DUF1537 family)
MVVIGLIADDLTGACDSALPFLAGGPVRVGLWPHVPSGPFVCTAISTESRKGPAAVSYARSREAALRLPDSDLRYRKLDSIFRGFPLADLAAVLDVTGGPCVVAPALPGEGRTTSGGVQRWPDGEVNLRELLRPLAGRIRLRDACTDADLDGVAGEVMESDDRLVAGTAGLAGALARRLGLGPVPAAPRVGASRPLAVVGSRAAVAQAEHARERGWDVQVLEAGRQPVVGDRDGLVLTGGSTAASVLRAADTRALDLLGEALPRAPLARVVGGRLDGLPVVLKAGAFGDVDGIHRALAVLGG